jgi:hypothetical protein
MEMKEKIEFRGETLPGTNENQTFLSDGKELTLVDQITS